MTITKRSADKCTPPFSNVINYQWGLPDNTDKVAPKISYTEVNPHWGWYISAGSYMEDYNNGANRVLDILLVTLGASLLVGMVIILLFSPSSGETPAALDQAGATRVIRSSGCKRAPDFQQR
ncbi:cache domain-containing protein [Brevibacillus composti]|uniref:Cache domain-containing protein n=1 Tax=Brevibacillus composti TaxID=2796470 RepID=A0A7T5EM38_9BACL|nr:cache domain-containing protein [Brevibacillus composti]QUO42152.1 cache domain-containing protein [Brevibacillus composti]